MFVSRAQPKPPGRFEPNSVGIQRRWLSSAVFGLFSISASVAWQRPKTSEIRSLCILQIQSGRLPMQRLIIQIATYMAVSFFPRDIGWKRQYSGSGGWGARTEYSVQIPSTLFEHDSRLSWVQKSVQCDQKYVEHINHTAYDVVFRKCWFWTLYCALTFYSEYMQWIRPVVYMDSNSECVSELFKRTPTSKIPNYRWAPLSKNVWSAHVHCRQFSENQVIVSEWGQESGSGHAVYWGIESSTSQSILNRRNK